MEAGTVTASTPLSSGRGKGSAVPRTTPLIMVVVLAAALGGCSQQPVRGATPTQAQECSSRVSPGHPLSATARQIVTVPGNPFAAVALPGGELVVTSLTIPRDFGDRGELAVLAVRRKARQVRVVPLPPMLGGASGMALTHDGKLLLVAAETATAVISVSELEDGVADPVVGILQDSGVGQYEVAISGDDRYAFVADEESGELSVFNLALARQKGFSAPGVAIGMIPLGPGAVGVAVAPDGAQVYVTTLGPGGPPGELWIVDSRRAEHGDGRAAVLGHVAAGCQPTRVAVSPDGRIVWVTALQSNALLGFSAAELARHPSSALRAVVTVGSEPVGLLLLDHGRAAVVADSNRFGLPGASPLISIVSTTDALAGHQAVVGYLRTGLFPRDLGYDEATGQILIADYLSDTVELLRVPTLP
jgi:DNA-binding beta-propeller fold protein YncE